MSPYEFLLRELRHGRVDAGITQDGLGERIHFSAQKVSAVETGRAPLTLEFVRLVDDGLKAGGRFVRMWEDLVKDGSAPTWLREWIEIEREATLLRWFEPSLVPGLLQTEAYARAVLSGSGLHSEHEINQRIAVSDGTTGNPAPGTTAQVRGRDRRSGAAAGGRTGGGHG